MGSFEMIKLSCMFQEGCAVLCATCRIMNRLKKGSMQEFGREGGAELWILVDKIAYKVFKGFTACRMMDRF